MYSSIQTSYTSNHNVLRSILTNIHVHHHPQIVSRGSRHGLIKSDWSGGPLAKTTSQGHATRQSSHSALRISSRRRRSTGKDSLTYQQDLPSPSSAQSPLPAPSLSRKTTDSQNGKTTYNGLVKELNLVHGVIIYSIFVV